MAASNEGVSTGTCLCGDIQWELSGALTEMSHCYCTMCRKVHGTAFSTNAVVQRAAFRWLAGEQKIGHFESRAGSDWPFCGGCGATVPGLFDDEVWLAVGPLEGDFKERPLFHIFVASAASWHEIRDALPRYDAFDPSYDGPEVAATAEAPQVPGKLSGSCFCGGVVYAIEGELRGLVNCHCSRCRRARAAAHGSNGFTTPSKLQWLQGEDLLRVYRLPDADRFGQTFCGTCSSPMPRVDREHDLVVVPAGSLDVDPGVRAAVHIYWGSKASWFEVDDELPRFSEGVPG